MIRLVHNIILQSLVELASQPVGEQSSEMDVVSNPVIVSVMQELQDANPELTVNSGFGFCAYGSKLLFDRIANE